MAHQTGDDPDLNRCPDRHLESLFGLDRLGAVRPQGHTNNGATLAAAIIIGMVMGFTLGVMASPAA